MLIATVATQRSGTKLLSRCFGSGTAVAPFGEIFNPDADQVGSFQRFMRCRGDALMPHGMDYILDAYFAEFNHIRDIVSFDIMYNQLTIPVMTWNTHGFRGFYGYLRRREAIVIRLTRNAFDSFMSMKVLGHVGGRAHRISRHDATPQIDPITLDREEFTIFLRNHRWYEQHAQEALAGYPYHYHLPYDAIKDSNQIPDELKNMISRKAQDEGLYIERDHIQMHRPRIMASGIDYREVVVNHNELAEIYREFMERS